MRGMAASESQLLVCHRRNPSLMQPIARAQDGQLLVKCIKKYRLWIINHRHNHQLQRAYQSPLPPVIVLDSSSESECGYDRGVNFIVISSDESERGDGMELIWEVGCESIDEFDENKVQEMRERGRAFL